MKIEPWDKYEQIKLIKEQTLFKQLRRSLFFISNSKTSLQTSYGSPSKNASFLSEKPSHNKDSIFAHSTDAAADASNDSELSDSDSERYFSEALHRWEPPKTRQATIAADVELEGGGKGESLLCKLEETLIQCQWRKEDHELKKQKAKLKNKISTTYTDDNSTCANSTDSDSAKDFSEVDEDNTNTEFKERKLELIRKQIKEARRFKKEFGYWIKKMSVMDEEENAMWDEAEKKMEEDDERKERKWEMEEKNPTLEELKTMLCNAEKEGMSEQDVKELQNKIQRKEKKMEKKEIRKMLSDLERDQLKHLKRQTTTDYSLNNHSILQEATQTEKFESPLIFDFISPPSTPSAEIASDHSLSDRSQAFSSSSSRSLNCNTNSTKENSIFDVRISNKLIPQPSLFPTMSLFTFDEQFFKWIDSTVEEDPSNWVPTTKKPLLPAFPRIKHEFSPFRDFWLNINHFHPHIRATMNEHTIQRFSVQELVKAVASSDYLSFFPDEYFCSDASFHSDWIRYRQSLLASHIETKSIQRQNEGYGYITALSKAIPGHSSAAQRNPEMLLKMRKLKNLQSIQAKMTN
ncbi:uncharacterized protein MONOS_7284 [Monocercomonoides exilis]|uniref:uncharacterized protein n=1 Tax=Monocercomonoides exilis TaxID=2049356 RepID=UPI00355AB0B3|nr:hypothetical protein MONOS_7284 [Monocercomonoides exilis]|eukprot:MONOS_7284.1-p1 / transcript=MONOS_7284.1 / gene=MONOS_7284 / organism=Monocercomonoides_exilis_PA203 / gene_product=unspecified product / transcript_product=unspecified product / location=Mono_scaffold00246:17837-19640(+) / protein_length=576 / sequence_SO=supercontig / SO=protein_coding / is_pseudo=false